MLNEAQKYRDRETSAAVVIQKYWRMFSTKWKFLAKIKASNTIQRIFRGYNGRCEFLNKKQLQD